MAARKQDDLAGRLDSEPATGITFGTRSKIDVLFGDRPEVLESIKAAHARHISADRIAELLTDAAGLHVGGSSVKSWLKKQSA
jgi:hypothetical protein